MKRDRWNWDIEVEKERIRLVREGIIPGQAIVQAFENVRRQLEKDKFLSQIENLKNLFRNEGKESNAH